MKFNHLLFGSLAILLFGLIGCTDNAAGDLDMSELDENGLATVTINVTAEDIATRADASFITISKGNLIDMLVYEVYEVTTVNNNKTYTPLNYYKNVDPELASVMTGRLNASEAAVSFNALNGKTIVLKVNPDKEYAIAFWAQNSNCKAYTLNVADKGLQQLTVDYTGMKNNDESRDAFSGAIEFSGNTRELLKATLYRPFAQINVGTTGADYITSSKVAGGCYYTYSKMEVSGVADKLNILTDEIDETTVAGTVTLDWALLPAWVNENAEPSEANIVQTPNEQFLAVDLNNDNKFEDFLTKYNTIKKDENGKVTYLTETFKYVSMSYLLVPSKTTTFESDTESDSYKENGGTTLNNLKVYFANKNGIDNDALNDNASITGFELTFVPVNRNWRTNILGGLYAPFRDPNDPNNPGGDPNDPNNPGGDPNDPNNPTPDPDVPFDPSSIFSTVGVQVTVVTTYFGDNKPYINLSQLSGNSTGNKQ